MCIIKGVIWKLKLRLGGCELQSVTWKVEPIFQNYREFIAVYI